MAVGATRAYPLNRVLVALMQIAAVGATRMDAALAAPGEPAASPAAATTSATGDGGQAALAVREGAAALVRGNTAQAVQSYTDALKDQTLTSDRRGAILSDRAVAYARMGQTKLAIDDFNRSIQLFPEHAATYNNRGNLLLVLGLYREAIRDFDRAVLLAPGYAAAYANRAGAHDRLGEPDEAIRDYTRAIELTPSSAVPLAGRGRVLLGLGKPHAAIRDFGRAVSADARFANAYRGRAAAKLRIRRNDDAIEDLSRAIAFDNGNAELYVLRGQAYEGVRNFASAIRDFAHAIDLDPKSAIAYAGRGLCNGYVEAFDDAFADLNRAVDLDPKNATVFAYRAIVYNLAGQADVGLKDVETALKLDINRAEAYWARATILEAQGRAVEATADYRRALAGNAELALAAERLANLGGEMPDSSDVAVEGGAIPGWSVVARGGSYFAVNAADPALRVPLESLGTGQPKLIDWELRKPPLSNIGLLRFTGGTISGKDGPQDVEMAAIVDVEGRAVIAVETAKLGAKTAAWTWEEGKVTVASVDGVADEFNLRTSSGAPSKQQRAADRRADEAEDAALGATERARPDRERPQRQAGSQPRSSKPKSIFQLLFGN